MAKEKKIGGEAVHDARTLGVPRMIVLGLQHTFAMFGATVLVPMLTGLNISTTLLMAGLGTLFFHLVTKGRIPAFLGSSFAFLGGYAAVAPQAGRLVNGVMMSQAELLPYACLGIACAGLVYLVLSGLIRLFGINKVMRFFPPVVTGPIIIAIGLILAPSAITNCSSNWVIALVALLVIIICNIWGKGMIKIIPIILGVAASYLVALIWHFAGDGTIFDFTAVKEAAWLGFPVYKDAIVFGNIGNTSLVISSILAILPISLATIMEHIGDISAISATTGKNFIADPGLHRSLIGDGVATTFAALFGAPANTTYGENTGVLALTRVYDPKVVGIAALFAIVLSFSPKVAAVIGTIPVATIGGISLILYGMISAVGVRNIVENQVDFKNSRNLIIAAVILVSALGFNATGGLSFSIGNIDINLSGLAVAAIAGILLNAILPGNEYKFKSDDAVPEASTFKL